MRSHTAGTALELSGIVIEQPKANDDATVTSLPTDVPPDFTFSHDYLEAIDFKGEGRVAKWYVPPLMMQADESTPMSENALPSLDSSTKLNHELTKEDVCKIKSRHRFFANLSKIKLKELCGFNDSYSGPDHFTDMPENQNMIDDASESHEKNNGTLCNDFFKSKSSEQYSKIDSKVCSDNGPKKPSLCVIM